VGFTHSENEAPLGKKNNERKTCRHNCEIKRNEMGKERAIEMQTTPPLTSALGVDNLNR
jgi:hypothetical protein